MDFLVIVIMYLNLLGADIQDRAPAATTEQALVELREIFPDWQGSYVIHEWDCSEMSRLVYDYLQARGLDPVLRCGYSEELGYAHAWVECESHVIECVGLNTVDPFRAWYDYFSQSIEVDASEWDWWDSEYVIDKMGPNVPRD